MKERIIVAKHPAQYIYGIQDAMVAQDSDVVITPQGVWWDKYNDGDFVTCALPYDTNVYSFNRETIRVAKGKHIVHLQGKVLSIVGVFSFAWSHFLFQFLGKLFYAGEAGLLDNEITLLTNDFNDPHIEQILNDYLRKYPHVKIVRTVPNVYYQCEYLVCMPSLTSNYNEVRYYLDYDFIKPKGMIDLLEKYVVDPLVERIKNNPVKHPKLFLDRSSNRTLNNREEVVAYFKSIGFYFADYSKLSLEEKVDLFYHAEVIVGMHGSAWQNLIFANGAKCLMFTNNRFSTEQIFYTMAKEHISDWLNVTGYDNDATRRSNYTISLDKIKEAYSVLIK